MPKSSHGEILEVPIEVYGISHSHLHCLEQSTSVEDQYDAQYSAALHIGPLHAHCLQAEPQY